MKYFYPTYGIEVTQEMMKEVHDTAVRLLDECGFRVPHELFLSKIRGKSGIRIDGEKVYFEPGLSRKYLGEWIANNRSAAEKAEAPEPADEWSVRTAGFSMMVRDVETDEVRPATRQDLRNAIKLANSYDIGGSYCCMPQDVPPLMRAITCFKICYEMSDNFRPYDYQKAAECRYIYEMCEVMDKTFDLTLCVPTHMTIDPKDIDVFLEFYDDWKAKRNINFVTLDYPMCGVTKPITMPGCAAMILTETLAVHMLFKLFDPEVAVGFGMSGGIPVDLKNTCWAWGSPRKHLFDYLRSQLMPKLAGYDVDTYGVSFANLETSSPASDIVAGMEKMARGLMAAMQGCRSFGYLGVLCVDDVFSFTQFVIDLEIVNHIREMIESFNPHPDILSSEGMWEECRDVCLGKEEPISHINTVRRFRNIMPSPERIIRQKLRPWMVDPRLLIDRAREEAIERIKTFEPRKLPEDKQKALDEIYARAERELGG